MGFDFSNDSYSNLDGQTQWKAASYKHDALPPFAVNYLELIDGAMQNLSYKKALLGDDNPFTKASTLVT